MRNKWIRDGFTLIELLIVIAIIGILAAIAVPNFMSARIRAKLARVQCDFHSIRNTCEMYRIDTGTFPANGRYHSLLNLLTTPTAYIARVPLDVFPSVHPLAPGIHYYSPYPYSPCRGRKSYRYAVQSSTSKTLFTAYYLASVGPDGIAPIEEYSRWDYPNVAPVIFYGVSNGLRSYGNIIHETSPELRSARTTRGGR